jgi:hypothetical protein
MTGCKYSGVDDHIKFEHGKEGLNESGGTSLLAFQPEYVLVSSRYAAAEAEERYSIGLVRNERSSGRTRI